jgi:hypothetical protein
MGVSFTTLQPTLGIAHGDLMCDSLALETHFLKLPTNSYCTDVASDAVWNFVVSVATEDRQFLHTTHVSTQWSCSVSLCGLPLRGGTVAPRHFHFTITALKVDWGTSSKAEI